MTYPDKIYIGQISDGTLGLCNDEYAVEYIRADKITPATSCAAARSGTNASMEAHADPVDAQGGGAIEALMKIIDNVIRECEKQMSDADRNEKSARRNNNEGEVYHQQGRWHCSNSIRVWAETHKATLQSQAMQLDGLMGIIKSQKQTELASIKKVRERDAAMRDLAAALEEMASYANESKPKNTPEFMEGLFERVQISANTLANHEATIEAAKY